MMARQRRQTRSRSATAGRDQRLIVEQIDPRHLVPGGIDTCIHDIVQYAPEASIALAGITRNPGEVGRWTTVELAGRSIRFFPVAYVNRDERRGVRNAFPHSLRVALGVLRHRRELVGWEVVQTHRVETGLVARMLLQPGRRIQFIHNDSKGLTGENSDSAWRRLGWAYKWIERLTLPSSAGVVIFNRTDGPRVAALQPETLIARTWFNPKVFAGVRRRTLVGEDPFRVLFVGRLESQKDPELVVETFAKLVSRKEAALLTVVGSGSLEEDMRVLAKKLGVAERVDFVGSASRAQVAHYMAESAVLLLPSHYEGSPRVIAEAGAVGLPVVATIGGDPDEYLVRGENGIRVLDREPSSLATAVLEAANYDPAVCIATAAGRSAPAAIERLLNFGSAVRPPK